MREEFERDETSLCLLAHRKNLLFRGLRNALGSGPGFMVRKLKYFCVVRLSTQQGQDSRTKGKPFGLWLLVQGNLSSTKSYRQKAIVKKLSSNVKGRTLVFI